MIAGPADPHRSLRTECGVDIIEIDRIERAINRWGGRFFRHIYTDEELIYCRGRVPELAVRFAGKEAVSKALGTGMRGIHWRDIEILTDQRGKPLVYLHAHARHRSDQLGMVSWAISLSHSRTMAIAFTVALRSEDGSIQPSGFDQTPV